ncbi:hypothetical protein Pmar_PMAR009744, partial [Perkinsus marinus ATCC 50983]
MVANTTPQFGPTGNNIVLADAGDNIRSIERSILADINDRRGRPTPGDSWAQE